MRIKQQICGAVQWMKLRVATFNLFENEDSQASRFDLRTGIISTRIYAVLFTVLITYTSILREATTIII